jgi:hypothetical protein
VVFAKRPATTPATPDCTECCFLVSETFRIPTLHARRCPLEGSDPARSRSKPDISKAEKGNTNTALLPLIMLHQQLHLPFPDTTKQSLCPTRATLHIQRPSFHPRTPLANSTSRSPTHHPNLHRLKNATPHPPNHHLHCPHSYLRTPRSRHRGCQRRRKFFLLLLCLTPPALTSQIPFSLSPPLHLFQPAHPIT